MKKTIQYRKNNKVASISDKLLKSDLKQAEVDITQKMYSDITSGAYDTFYKNGKIHIKETESKKIRELISRKQG